MRKRPLPLLFFVRLMFACECFCLRRIFSFKKKKKKQAWNYLDSFNSLYCWKKLSSLWTSQKTYLKNLLVIFADFQQSKTPFGETRWLTGCHATPLVTLFIWYHHVTYRSPCHVSGHPWSTTSATNLRERFLPCTPSCWAQAFPWSRQFNLKVSRVSCWSSKHSPEPTIRLNHNNPQTRYGVRLCLRVMKSGLVWYVWSANKESASYGIRTLYTIGEHVRSLMLSIRPQSHTVYDKLKV